MHACSCVCHWSMALSMMPCEIRSQVSMLQLVSFIFEFLCNVRQCRNITKVRWQIMYAFNTYIHTNKFLTWPTYQFASESGALRWYQKQLWVARFKQFSFKPVLKCQKRISWTGVDTKRVPDCRSGCTKRCLCKWCGWLLLKEKSWSWA